MPGLLVLTEPAQGGAVCQKHQPVPAAQVLATLQSTECTTERKRAAVQRFCRDHAAGVYMADLHLVQQMIAVLLQESTQQVLQEALSQLLG